MSDPYDQKMRYFTQHQRMVYHYTLIDPNKGLEPANLQLKGVATDAVPLREFETWAEMEKAARKQMPPCGSTETKKMRKHSDECPECRSSSDEDTEEISDEEDADCEIVSEYLQLREVNDGKVHLNWEPDNFKNP